jgi:short-subunit dehydrogenase
MVHHACSSGFIHELAIAAAQNENTVVVTSRDVSKLANPGRC